MSEHYANSNESGFNDISVYDWAEYDYPGYAEFIEWTSKLAISCDVSQDLKIIEIGPGSGALSKRLAEGNNVAQVTAVDINQASIDTIRAKQESGELPENIIPVQGNFIQWSAAPENHSSAHVVVSNLVKHHIRQSDQEPLLAGERQVLFPGGLVIAGDAFLRDHDESSAKARINAHLDLHGEVIIDAFERGKLQFPIMELEALISGLGTIHPFMKETVPDYSPAIMLRKGSPHIANQDAITALDAILKRAETASEALGEWYSDAKEPESDVAAIRIEFIDKLKGAITLLESSPVSGILPEALAERPDICEIGACDYKVTLRHYAKLCESQGLTMQAWKIRPQDSPEALGKFTADDKRFLRGGLYSTVIQTASDSQQEWQR